MKHSINEYICFIILAIIQFLSLVQCFLARTFPSDSFIFYCVVIFLTVIGFIALYFASHFVMQKKKEEIELKTLEETNKRNLYFYQYADLQQQNIRFFYHDLVNHLITIKLLKDDNKEKECEEYMHSLEEYYQKLVPSEQSDNLMIDILVQYFKIQEFPVSIHVLSSIPIDFDYTSLFSMLDKIQNEKITNEVTLEFKEDQLHVTLSSSSSITSDFPSFIFHEREGALS